MKYIPTLLHLASPTTYRNPVSLIKSYFPTLNLLIGKLLVMISLKVLFINTLPQRTFFEYRRSINYHESILCLPEKQIGSLKSHKSKERFMKLIFLIIEFLFQEVFFMVKSFTPNLKSPFLFIVPINIFLATSA